MLMDVDIEDGGEMERAREDIVISHRKLDEMLLERRGLEHAIASLNRSLEWLSKQCDSAKEEAKVWFEVHTLHQRACMGLAKASGELLKRVIAERDRADRAEGMAAAWERCAKDGNGVSP